MSPFHFELLNIHLSLLSFLRVDLSSPLGWATIHTLIDIVKETISSNEFCVNH